MRCLLTRCTPRASSSEMLAKDTNGRERERKGACRPRGFVGAVVGERREEENVVDVWDCARHGEDGE